MIDLKNFLLVILTWTCFIGIISASKSYSGQKIFMDANIIDFADPAKHGFHIVLNEDFVNTHLQPIRLPTIFVTAIALKQSPRHYKRQDWTNTSLSSLSSNMDTVGNTGLRVTKILYPENVDPDGGLLDGRTIKLLGLQERTWYYVCVEFESNLNRHESATGASCLLKRTLDKFGKGADSTVADVELAEITDKWILIKLHVETDFPLRLSISLSQDESETRTIPSQTFILDTTRMLNVNFGPNLESDRIYGSVCILEEPLPIPSTLYTAMGRSVNAAMKRCYFQDLKTTPAVLKQNAERRTQFESNVDQMEDQAIRATFTNSATESNLNVLGLISYLIGFFLIGVV